MSRTNIECVGRKSVDVERTWNRRQRERETIMFVVAITNNDDANDDDDIIIRLQVQQSPANHRRRCLDNDASQGISSIDRQADKQRRTQTDRHAEGQTDTDSQTVH